MWCEDCNIVVNNETCPYCDKKTRKDIPVEIYWCDRCNIPLIKEINALNKNKCTLCKGETRYLSKDLRPVFPEERLLVEVLEKKPFAHELESVWCSGNRYFFNAKSKTISNRRLRKTNSEPIRKELKHLFSDINYESFNTFVDKFLKANNERLNKIKEEAYTFINQVREGYTNEEIVVSFSGGKDSTVISDLVIKSIGDASIVHIFGDTTLEFPLTLEYKERFRKANFNAIVRVAQNKEQEFYKVCEEIGPPARLMRWCCTMFKTGPISRVLSTMYRNKRVLTFYGIRREESVSRSKYERIYESPKIAKQTVAAPIFNWKDLDVWLYILHENIDFNDAYRYGYDRVGCWCCPNNSERSQFLSKIYMPEQSKQWRDFLISFARKIGKPDAENYIDVGNWKARQGGYGVEAANEIKLHFTNCTTDENAKIYKTNRPIDDDFLSMFTPFGVVSKELGRKLIDEVIILEPNTNVPIISIQPYTSLEYESAVKIQTMNVRNHNNLQRMISYQIKKSNFCRKCLACEALCNYRAISVSEDGYRIDPSRCVRCKICVTEKYITGGCLMTKYLYISAGGEKNEI